MRTNIPPSFNQNGAIIFLERELSKLASKRAAPCPWRGSLQGYVYHPSAHVPAVSRGHHRGPNRRPGRRLWPRPWRKPIETFLVINGPNLNLLGVPGAGPLWETGLHRPGGPGGGDLCPGGDGGGGIPVQPRGGHCGPDSGGSGDCRRHCNQSRCLYPTPVWRFWTR